MKKLVSFTNTPHTSRFSVTADVTALAADILRVDFDIAGPVEEILWPSADSQVVRQDGLWQTTCLEAFFAAENTPQSPYFEINCAPNGNWNAYTFQSYREGMTPSPRIEVHLTERSGTLHHAQFQIEVRGLPAQNATFFGLCTVLEFKNGEKSYWALKHLENAPNFHDKKAWYPVTTR